MKPLATFLVTALGGSITAAVLALNVSADSLAIETESVSSLLEDVEVKVRPVATAMVFDDLLFEEQFVEPESKKLETRPMKKRARKVRRKAMPPRPAPNPCRHREYRELEPGRGVRVLCPGQF